MTTTTHDSVILISEKNNEKRYYCEVCGVEHTVYKISFAKLHIDILRKIFAYCVTNKVFIFHKRDLGFLSHTQYGNFYMLRRFGFLYWIEEDGKRIKGGKWGVNVKRMRKFLKGEWAVAKYSEKNTATGESRNSEERVLISEIPRYTTLIEDNNNYMPYFIEYDKVPDFFKESDKNISDNE